MWQIFIGSLALSLIHAAIPNHWIPLVAIGKTEKWTMKETLSATLIIGFAHTLSTILIGIIVGFIGIRLANIYSSLMTYISPSILIAMGTVYIFLDLKNNLHHHHHHDKIDAINKKNKTKAGILFGLSLAMFLTPCVEIETYYFQAGMMGWKGIFILSAVYIFSTVSLMLILVYSCIKGTQRLRLHTLEHHEKLFTGTVLVGLGLLAFFVDF